MPKANKRKLKSDKNDNNKRLKTGNSAQNTSSKPEKGINDLPNEMLLKIFSYLGQKDILSCTQAKKKWNNLISNTEKTMKKIQTVYISNDHMICGIPKFTRPYTKIEVQNVKLECDINLLNRLVKIGSGIKTVVFDHCWFLGNAMTSFLKCFKNLKDLHITHCEITKVPVHRKIVLKELDMLHLDIYSWPLAYIESPKLTKLQCHTMLVEDQKLIMSFLNNQTKLEVLDLNCCYNMFHSTPEHLDPKFKLKELKLNDMMDYDKAQMTNLLSSMTDSVTSLEIGIDMGRDITNYALKNFVNLESLTIDCDSLPNSPSFYNDMKTSQTLKTVEIGGEMEKTMSVLQFLEHHPEIESLDLSAVFNLPTTRYSFWSRFAGVTEKVGTLKLDTLDADNVRYIKSKNLKEFKTYSLEFIDINDWIEFCRNNPNIERFYVYGTDDSFNVNDVKTVLTQNLAKLKEFSANYQLE